MTSWPKRKWCWAGCRVVGREDGVNLAGWEVNGIGGFCVGFFFSNTFFFEWRDLDLVQSADTGSD